MSFDPITAAIDGVKEVIKRIWPEKMSEAEEAQIDAALSSAFRQFILQYEGTAKDYSHIKFVGPVVMLFRGLIRPAITVADAYWLQLYFTNVGEWSPEKVGLLKAVTLLVLAFWFGERAIKAVMPALTKFMESKK